MPQSWHNLCTSLHRVLPELAVHAFTAALRRCSACTVFSSSGGRELSHSFTDSRVSNVVKSAAGPAPVASPAPAPDGAGSAGSAGCPTLLGAAADLRAGAGASKTFKLRLRTTLAVSRTCVSKSSQRADSGRSILPARRCTPHSVHTFLILPRFSREAGAESAVTATWRRFNWLVSKDSAGKVLNQRFTSATVAMTSGVDRSVWGASNT